MKPGTPRLKSTRLLDQMRERISYMHYSLRTEKVYLYGLRFFIRWHGQIGQMRHPRDIVAPGVEAFLTFLATERKDRDKSLASFASNWAPAPIQQAQAAIK